MKKGVFSIALLLLGFYMVNGQQNVVKLSSVDVVKVGLAYERVINENQSITINISILPSIGINNILLNAGTKAFGVDSDADGYSIVPEYRFYLGSQDAPRGFYLAPYLKYTRYNLKFKKEFGGVDIKAKGTYGSTGGGLQMGYQWILSEVFTIDWGILGLELDNDYVSVKYQSDNESINFQALQTEIEENFSDIPFVSEKFDVSSGDDFVKGKSSFLLPGIRVSFSIGYAF